MRIFARTSRRLATLSALAAACSVAASSSASAGFPYIAYVTGDDAEVHSGPGKEHYATGSLPAGFAVEVYRHDDGGWCAVRPPEGSFSLAPASELRILDSRTAEVTGERVAARVGSAAGEHRSAVQVLLKRGELVQVFEPPTPGAPWVKIGPPAGEFRWIAARRLSRTPPVEGRPSSPMEKWRSPGAVTPPVPDAAPPQGGDEFAHLSSAEETAGSPSPLPAVGGVRLAASDDVHIVEGSPAAIDLAAVGEQPAGDAATSEATPAGAATRSTGQPRIRFHGLSVSGPMDQRVAEMQLRLSQIVVEAPATWQLAGLREEAAALLAGEPSTQVRAELRDLLDRIATFETVAQRYRNPPLAAAAGPAAAGQPVAAPAAASGLTGQSGEVMARIRSDLGPDAGITPTPGVQPPQTPSTGSFAIGLDRPPTQALYDAVGTLKPVVSRREHAPRYALVDDHGDVVAFVTASADTNLQPYVGKRIGVRGSRGFMPEYRRAHVTASRVTPLEEKLVR
jgi:hypothetical protein